MERSRSKAFKDRKGGENENPFRKDIEPRCAYCAHGSTISDREVACSRRGVVDSADSCRHFRYDPLRRVPPR